MVDAVEADQRLTAWGRTCKQTSEALGIPTISGIAHTIAHIRAQTRLQKKKRRQMLRARRRARKEGDPPTDCKLVAEEFGFVEQDLTAQGKETLTISGKRLSIDSNAAQVDAVVALLPGWAKKCVYRTYLYGQPDRFAASDLKMPVEEYARRRRAAVEQVAVKLTERYSAPVEPMRFHSTQVL